MNHVVMQRESYSGNVFQEVTREKFEEVVPNIIQWMEDFLLHSKTEDDLLDSIKKYCLSLISVHAF